MRVALYVISILWIVLGTLLIIYTESTKGFLKKLFYTEHIRLLAILPVLFGLILGIGAFLYKGDVLASHYIRNYGYHKGGIPVYWAVTPDQKAF